MASTEAYAGGDYGRGDGDASVNRAPPPAQGMPASKDEVEEAPAIDWDDPANYRYNYRLPISPPNEWHDRRKREVYGEGKDGEKVLVRLNMAMKGGQGCCGPSQMLRGKDRTTLPQAFRDVGMSWEEYHDVFVAQLDAIENEHFPESSCRGCVAFAPKLGCCLFGSLLTVGCLLPFFNRKLAEGCAVMEQRCKSFDADLREWQTNANAMFEKYHVYLKTQSHCYTAGQERICQRWIVVALNDDDAARLSTEPHLSGIVMKNEPQCGSPRTLVDETAGFCTHPYRQVRSDTFGIHTT